MVSNLIFRTFPHRRFHGQFTVYCNTQVEIGVLLLVLVLVMPVMEAANGAFGVVHQLWISVIPVLRKVMGSNVEL